MQINGFDTLIIGTKNLEIITMHLIRKRGSDQSAAAAFTPHLKEKDDGHLCAQILKVSTKFAVIFTVGEEHLLIVESTLYRL